MSLKNLHENIANFTDKVQKEYSSEINCKSGCDQCCHVAIGTFSIEADFIVDWFKSLDDERKESLLSLWNEKQLDGLDLFNQKVRPCAFLYEGICSIYESRPVICRTQGLPMIRKDSDNYELDVCSLNFKGSTPTVDLSFDLNRLNMLLSLAQNSKESAYFDKERVTLNQIKKYLKTLTK